MVIRMEGALDMPGQEVGDDQKLKIEVRRGDRIVQLEFDGDVADFRLIQDRKAAPGWDIGTRIYLPLD